MRVSVASLRRYRAVKLEDAKERTLSRQTDGSDWTLAGTRNAAHGAAHGAPSEMDGRRMTLEKAKSLVDVSFCSTNNARRRSA